MSGTAIIKPEELLPVILLTGAGASFPFGYPTTPEFMRRFEQESSSGLWQRLTEDKKEVKDIEHVLQLIDKLLNINEDKRTAGFLLRASSANLNLIGEGTTTWDGLVGKVKVLRQKIVDTLFRYYEFNPETKEAVLKTYESLLKFISQLNLFYRGKEQVGIFTLNYDQTIEKFCEFNDTFDYIDGFSPKIKGVEWEWNPGVFDSEGTIRGFARTHKTILVKLHKLHGSLNWRKTTDDKIQKLPTEEKTSGTKVYAENVLIYPGDFKDTIKEPFRTLLDRFEKQMQHGHMCIVIGYSFRDDHINKIIFDFLRNPSRTLIVVSPHAYDNIKSQSLLQGFAENALNIKYNDAQKIAIINNSFIINNSSIIVAIDMSFQDEKFLKALQKAIERHTSIYVIDYSPEFGSLTGERVIVIGKEAYHMGQPYDDWVRAKGLMIAKGTGSSEEHLSTIGIKDKGGPPLSVEWLEAKWKEMRGEEVKHELI